MRLGPGFVHKRDQLFAWYRRHDRAEALVRLDEAIDAAIARIEAQPNQGLGCPPRYEGLRAPGVFWIREHRYWFAWILRSGEPVLVTLYFERAIPDRYFTA